MKKVISLILILGLAVMFLVGCSSKVDNPKVEEVKELENLSLNVAAPTGAPNLSMIKMFKENPSFGDHIEINYETIKSPDLLASRIISGEIDIAVVPTNLAATLYNRGVDYKIAASSVWGVLYLVGNEEINGWDDLRGKEIHTMGRGLTPDVVLRYLLTSNGLDPEKDVTLTYVGEAAELASTFIAGKSAISVIPEPALSNVMMKKEGTNILFDLQEEWAKLNKINSSYPQASLIIKSEIIEKDPEFVQNFLMEYENSIKWLHSNAPKAGEYSEELETGLSKGAVVNGLGRSNIEYRDIKSAKESIEKYLNVLFEYAPETIGGKLPDEGFYFQK
ncbi:ABC transporter substrate-binding protein [Serpentinicella alkaliphila]|uniref:NitT/TauT family transport system substrate-binding protein n=1 Tax=Serpentinicella alkaliphila TaxID=1734049 RepID=A0A4R2TB19_9FIRM|nr:MqnA/MqnD/SBP family protein [Serpentinicella alkaliphila]QUH24795.1 ABC transporter substrate-binding protein [Serpentinicella alkaliphila]TCP98976.1 NitT/TauT family transport system substrate-binding protein [Serpentinicella alkaliphila]